MNIYCCHPTVPGCDLGVMYAASAGAMRWAGCIAWNLAWTHCAIMDSPLGLSFWKKVCFIQRPRAGSSAQPAMARAARFVPGGCGDPTVSTQPSWAPGSGLSHLTSVDALLPGGLTRAAPVPTSLLIPSFLPQALGEAGGSSV